MLSPLHILILYDIIACYKISYYLITMITCGMGQSVDPLHLVCTPEQNCFSIAVPAGQPGHRIYIYNIKMSTNKFKNYIMHLL